MPGPAPKPTKIRLMEGNPGKRAINKHEPEPTAGIRSRPEWLLPEAKREWVRICGELERLGVLTTVDRGVLAAYCQAWARWAECEQYLSKNGMTQKVNSKVHGESEQQRPQVTMAQKYFQLMMTAAGKLGLSPADRSKVTVSEKPKTDSWEALLD